MRHFLRLSTAFPFGSGLAGARRARSGLCERAEVDAPKTADSPLTGRYEGSHILSQTMKAFDELTLRRQARRRGRTTTRRHFTKTLAAQGKITRTIYVAPMGRSSLEVFNNYRSEVAAKGFAPVFECAKEACGPSFMVLKYRWDTKTRKCAARATGMCATTSSKRPSTT